MNEKEFRKYVRQSYREGRPNTLYIAILILLLVVVVTFVFVSTETGVERFESTIIVKNQAEATSIVNEINQGLQETGSLLADLEGSAGG